MKTTLTTPDGAEWAFRMIRAGLKTLAPEPTSVQIAGPEELGNPAEAMLTFGAISLYEAEGRFVVSYWETVPGSRWEPEGADEVEVGDTGTLFEAITLALATAAKRRIDAALEAEDMAIAYGEEGPDEAVGPVDEGREQFGADHGR